MQKEKQNKLYSVVDDYVSKSVISTKNKAKSWEYGYNSKYNMVVISKTGQIGDVYRIQGLHVALPLCPKKIETRHNKWVKHDLPKPLSYLKSIFDWERKESYFQEEWVDYIENEFNKREEGYWFLNNNVPTYITGSHYMYLQWTKIDIGSPEFREANRIFYIFWEACVADSNSFGMCYLKNRRSGFSFMSSSEAVDTATMSRNARVGILSKKGNDAKKMFTDKVVPISSNYPFFFKPIQDGMDKPKSELAYRVPASKITKKSLGKESELKLDGLDTVIDWKNTSDNSYDGEKLKRLIHDESGKWERPDNILNNWRITKTCLRLGRKIVGKCLMGSTSNALDKGGDNFKYLYNNSRASEKNKNNQTKSGLYCLFIPMEWNMEGFIDQYGWPVLTTPPEPVMGIDGEWIEQGVIEWWENEVDSKSNDSAALNEFYRQFPRTEAHAFRDESKQSIYNLTKIYDQVDYNDGMIKQHYLTQGSFRWANGIKDSKVVWTPDKSGRFLTSWTPPANLQNNVIQRNGRYFPGNEHIGAFGCDSYDISGTVGGVGSNGALHGLTGFNMDHAPSNEFFLEYIARPQTAEMFFEDVLMAIVFYGMPILVENNKPRLLYHLKNRGYRGFSINRPDKPYIKLSGSEKELGGVPNSSEDMKQSHAAAIESYIEKYIGYDKEGKYRDPEEMGTMPFNRTLLDWAKFDINNRTKYDASISSGLAIMANQRHLYRTVKKESKISINFARYDNKGQISTILK